MAEAERQITLSVADSSSEHGVFQPAVIRSSFQANTQRNLVHMMGHKQTWYPFRNMDCPSEMLCGTSMRSYMLATCLTRTLPVIPNSLRSCLIRYYTRARNGMCWQGIQHLSYPSSDQKIPFYPSFPHGLRRPHTLGIFSFSMRAASTLALPHPLPLRFVAALFARSV